MRYEVIEDQDDWVVARDGCELARFADQDTALQDVADRLKAGADRQKAETDGESTASLAVRYRTRGA
jgi:hypothetical protein